MKFTLTIDCEGAAFRDEDDDLYPQAEVARILRLLARRVAGVGGIEAGDYWPLIDINGNQVGVAWLEEQE